MPKRLVAIDGNDNGHFFLSVQGGTLMVGTSPAQASIILGECRAVRIHCEVEVDEEPIVLGNDPAVVAAVGQALQPGQALHVGPSHVRMVALGEAPDVVETPAADTVELPALDEDLNLADPEPAYTPPPTQVAAAALDKRLLVIDGADKGRSFALNTAGRVAVGKSAKHADIVLHDLFVARVHCELDVAGDGVRVTHVEGQNGTLVNGQPITAHQLHLGDVIRVGNSQLRFEVDVPAAPKPVEVVPEVDIVEVVEETEADLVAPLLSPVDALAELEGQPLGHFQIGTVLGRGLFGCVFRAEDQKTKQPVALKVLAPEFPANDGELKSYVRILMPAAPLRHPHLVAVAAAGKSGRYCWLARDLVEGESIAALIERLKQDDKLGWKRGCRVAIHLARLLTFLEERQIVHTRFTPTNVLVETGTKATKVAGLILDRALAGSQLAATIEPDRRLAELPYRAPEQTKPDGAIDLRTSLYAVGALAYAVMTGVPPFTGATPEAIIRNIHEAKLAKPRRFVPEIPPPFETAVLRLLSRNPDERFRYAQELLDAIEPIAEQHEVSL
jgi:pSer/pThr/pTyr-binding forkhead associated (FHA) protein